MKENLDNGKIITIPIKYNGDDAYEKPITEEYIESEHLKRNNLCIFNSIQAAIFGIYNFIIVFMMTSYHKY